ncbi:hypothetical protein XC61_13635, partial [Klebsiella pneumoniae]|nr:hypothetical protein [Klebsiella pneumoniae]
RRQYDDMRERLQPAYGTCVEAVRGILGTWPSGEPECASQVSRHDRRFTIVAVRCDSREESGIQHESALHFYQLWRCS